MNGVVGNVARGWTVPDPDTADVAMAGIAVEAASEVVRRFEAERARIVGGLLGGRDPGPVAGVEAVGFERYPGGRAETVVRFADPGVSVLYIPRPMDAAQLYTALLAWLDARRPGLAPPAVPTLASGHHGWSLPARPAECATPEGARRFHRRQGARLALLHATNATSPETLLHPPIERPVLVDRDPAVTAYERSVLRTLIAEESDASGIEPATLDGAPLDPAAHLDDLLRGFALAYDAISQDPDSFCAELKSASGATTRFLPRPVAHYLPLLAARTPTPTPDRSLNPDLNPALEPTPHPHPLDPLFTNAERLLPHEHRALAAGHIPLFLTRPDSRTVRTPDGRHLPDLLPHSGLGSAVARVHTMDPDDRRRQEWIVEAAFAARTGTVHHWCLATGSAAADTGTGAPDPGRALDRAVTVAHELSALAYRDGRRVNWLGLEPLESPGLSEFSIPPTRGTGRWAVLPAGIGLPHGHSGIALFLAQLGTLTGRAEFLDLAADAMAAAPALVAAFAESPAHLAAIGGGFSGLGGVAYALRRISTLLKDEDLRQAADLAAHLAASAPDDAGPLTAAYPDLFNDSWCHGLASRAAAGALDAADLTIWLARLATTPPLTDLTVCHGEFGLLEALAVLATKPTGAEQARATLHRRLARLPDPIASGAAFTGTPGAVPTPGFLHGLAGVGYGLLRTAFPDTVPSVLTLAASP